MTVTVPYPGFADPVRDSQAVFRTLMDAMARPGTLGRISPPVEAPAPLRPGCASLVLTLCDNDTPVWLDAGLAASPGVAAFIRFHTGAPIVSEPGEAAFALVADPACLLPLDRFALGTIDYPDRSTTLIVAVETLDDGAGWRLRGPGVDGEARFAAVPLPDDVADCRRALATLFPRGLDMVFVAGDRVAALPRSTRVEL